MNLLLLGAIAMASLTIGIFFLRFWKSTGDQFFLFFAISFLLEGVNRVALGLVTDPNEGRPIFYLVRFISFIIICVAIIQKNRTKSVRFSASKTTRRS
jgi:uncharacterized membrane protein HdeD (DUF308 family)